MHAAYAMVVGEFEKSGLSLADAVERMDESLLPPAEAAAAHNRRAFAHLIAGAQQGRTADNRFGVRRK